MDGPFNLYWKSPGSALGLLKVITITCIAALVSIPISLDNIYNYPGDAFSAVFSLLGLESMFLVVFVMPPAIGALALGYFITKDSRQKRFQNAGYSYVAGFLAGMMILFLFFAYIGAMLMVGLAGFSVGVLFSFISTKPHDDIKKAELIAGAPFNTESG